MFGALLGGIGSIAGGFMQADAAEQAADDLNEGLNVRKLAMANGYSLKDIFGKRLKPPDFKIKERDIVNRILPRLGAYASGQGLEYATRLSEKANAEAVQQLESSMSQLFGGHGAYEKQRDAYNDATNKMLNGELSKSAQRALSRRAIRGGASAIGPDSVSDTYASYIGTTTEDIVARGAQQYRSMYATYRQALPFVSPFEALQYTAPTAAQGLDFSFRAAENQYAAQLNQAYAEAAPDPVASGHINAEMQRALAVAGANLQAGSAMGSAVSNAGNTLGGLFQGGSTGGFM